jgi:hypothetical protein
MQLESACLVRLLRFASVFFSVMSPSSWTMMAIFAIDNLARTSCPSSKASMVFSIVSPEVSQAVLIDQITTSETNSTCKLTVLRVEPHVIPAHKRMRIIPYYFLTELHGVRFILL